MLIWYGPSAFIDQIFVGDLLKVFYGTMLESLVPLAALWLYFRKTRRLTYTPLLSGNNMLFGVFILYVCIESLNTLITYEANKWMLAECFHHFAFLSYFLFMDIFRRFDEDEIGGFLDGLSIVNSLYALIFTLHAVGRIALYSPEYIRWYVPAPVTFPPLTALVIFYLLSRSRLRWVDYTLLALNFLAVVSANWRHAIIAIVVLSSFLYLSRGSAKLKKMALQFSSLLAAGLILWVLMASTIPEQVLNAKEKFSNITVENGIARDVSGEVRLDNIIGSLSYMHDYHLFLGYGFVSSGVTNRMPLAIDDYLLLLMDGVDIVWSRLITQYGIIGLILFVLLLGGFVRFGIYSQRVARDTVQEGIVRATVAFLIYQIFSMFFGPIFLGNTVASFWFVPLLYLPFRTTPVAKYNNEYLPIKASDARPSVLEYREQ